MNDPTSVSLPSDTKGVSDTPRAMHSSRVGETRGAMGLGTHVSPFDQERKSAFLTLLSKWWPNISQTCSEIGISTPTYYNHLAKDKIFANQVEQIKRARIDRIESVAVNAAENPKSFLDRAMILRAYKPELYNPAKVVRVEGLQVSEAQSRARLAVAQGAIDAEIVQSHLNKQERKQLKSGALSVERVGGGEPPKRRGGRRK